jgi:hypothetical protein
VAALRGAQAARWLGFDGALNVNSVSARAWCLGFGRTIHRWADASDATTKLANPFFYFAQAAPYGGGACRGRREFSAAAVQTLATKLRAGILARGRPFVSLQDFVNSGVLRDAIAGAGLNTDPAFTADVGGPPTPYSPDFLTQAVVLNTLAPVLSARSDTFVIRAYGEAVNPAVSTDPAARAWCEAVVQRFPEYVDPADAAAVWPPQAADNQVLGRRLRIVDFRWLTQDDL